MERNSRRKGGKAKRGRDRGKTKDESHRTEDRGIETKGRNIGER